MEFRLFADILFDAENVDDAVLKLSNYFKAAMDDDDKRNIVKLGGVHICPSADYDKWTETITKYGRPAISLRDNNQKGR